MHQRDVGYGTSWCKNFFLLGSVRTQKEQLQIEEENEKHKDIIQGSFLDTYRNLSYKHAMTLKYVTYHCSQTKYVLKVDDDIFVNVPTILDFLKKDTSTYGGKGRMLCLPATILKVPRSKSKWTTSVKEYNATHFPPYCLGFSTIYSSDVVVELYREVQKTKYFWIEDVFVTGIARSKTNINISKIGSMYLGRKDMKKIISQKRNVPFIFSPTELTVKEISKFSSTKNEPELLFSDCDVDVDLLPTISTKSNLTFSGKGKTSLTDFLTRLDELSVARGISSSQLFVRATELLTGMAHWKGFAIILEGCSANTPV
ncbi:hypothetical protein FQR65_LT13218 [Abscondita terminalis]|nr:hypothetical protein FQR65_LT13218 [Abscondita terminalis]